MRVPTVKIQGENPGEYIIINEADFIEGTHQLWEPELPKSVASKPELKPDGSVSSEPELPKPEAKAKSAQKQG